MSDFEHTSLHEELEVRVIALLTGELSEVEADELEKILAIDPKLSAFRDRMAELMGDLHEARDELAPPEGEAPRELSAERRARIFGDASVLESPSRRKRVWLNPAYWGIAASIAMVFMIGILGTIKFQSAILREEMVFEAAPRAPESQRELEHRPALEQRTRLTPPPPQPQAIVVNESSALEIPSLDIDVKMVESAAYGRGGGGLGGGLAGVREMGADERRSADYAKVGETIPVEIPKELIEGTPQPIRVPNLEPAPTEAPRMVVTRQARESAAKENNQDAVSLSGVREMDLAMTEFGYSGDRAGKEKSKVDLFAGPPAPAEQAVRAKPKRAVPVGGYARSGPVDAFSAPVASRAQPRSETAEPAKPERRDAVMGDTITIKPAASVAENAKTGTAFFPISQKTFFLMVDGQEIDTSVEPTDPFSTQVASGKRGGANQETAGLEKFFEKAGVNFDLPGTSLAFDGEKLIVTQTRRNLERMGAILRKYDEAEPEVHKTTQNDRLTPKPEKLTAEEPFSTFSLNISDVSFKLAQAALESSRVPPASQIRTEEFVNSFDYGDPAPRPDEAVALHWEIAQHPFEHDRQVVRFSVQTQASGRTSGQPLNLTLLIDNSGSMQRPDRHAILRNSLRTLQEKLTEQDQLNIVLFARQPRLIAEAQTRVSQQAAVETALAYRPEGGTNLEAGLHAAYESARRHYRPGGNNRVILMTDGAANLGNVNPSELAEYVIEQRKQGIALDAYGIGWDDYNDALLEAITRNGDGRYAFLNSVEEASADFADKLAGTLRVAAADVKVQIEWNPERVQRYRQIGYDLHQLKKEDFRDNTVDAAEIGEAESGTALYVLKIDESPEILGGLGTLHVRYLDPASGLYREHSWPLPMPRQVPEVRAANPSMRLAISSAFFGERLADSPYASGYSFNDLYQMTSGLPEAFPMQPRVAQLQSMILQANELYGEK
ncbi:MAG: YfbK domain-containing protein [Opitutales bacterium]